ncbi:MBL fold metallo-hydrolase [Cellulomonas sp. URHE0023]|uniref:MBL fold metallo-hydrolase n=1 Tax=Cellulomonas sp. URHE0023 TaxID=1380354 RepID=UPI0004877045|nr:MBL fold metallo-hydrolase [Cellulomonas sp. URHE0023]
MTFWICRTCGVEHSERPDVCAICADERQWVPASGQAWATLEELADEGYAAHLTTLEPDLYAVTSTPNAGIGQQSKLVRTPDGSVLWDPIGFLDEPVVQQILALGPVVAIVASHPHMYGVQVEWSRRLGNPRVLVAESDVHWLGRPDPVVETWKGTLELTPGLTLSQPGGHFPGSAVLHWAAGAEGRGVLLAGDTVFANPDRRSVAFMRSYPNHLPLSAAVAERVAAHLEELAFDRLYGNFANVIDRDARAVVRRSADRHIAWVRGDHDDLT